MFKRFYILSLVLLFTTISVFAQRVPASYSNIFYDGEGKVQLQINDSLAVAESPAEAWLTLHNLQGNPKGTEDGIRFDFNDPAFSGLMYYGFIPYGDSRHPQPVFFSKTSKIDSGKTVLTIAGRMAGRFDMVGWESSGKGTLGYRILDDHGGFLYEGRISFTGTGPFEIDDTIVEGPFVNMLESDGATISFTTNASLKAAVIVAGKTFTDQNPVLIHEITISGLKPNTSYEYGITIGWNEHRFSFNTAPKPGSRVPFTFAYASDSRAGRGGGERDMYGANFYMMKKIMALNSYKNVRFMQFTGDLINGYLSNAGQIDLQYANWKRSVQPFAHYFPLTAAMGNHEAFMYQFRNGKNRYSIDKFPYDTNSAETIFAKNFVNPINGPDSEDGCVADPDKDNPDFPSYVIIPSCLRLIPGLEEDVIILLPQEAPP